MTASEWPPRLAFTERSRAWGEIRRRTGGGCGFLPGGDGFGAELACKGRERLAIAQSSRDLGVIRRRRGGDCEFSQGDDGFGAKLARLGCAPLAEGASLREKGSRQWSAGAVGGSRWEWPRWRPLPKTCHSEGRRNSDLSMGGGGVVGARRGIHAMFDGKSQRFFVPQNDSDYDGPLRGE